MVGSIQYLAEAIRHVRSANTMDLAASLPIATERIDMRYQWISRFLGLWSLFSCCIKLLE
jgi:hypothetical protein